MDKKNNDGLLEDMPEKRKKDGAFVRVGTTLYKLADMPLIGGGFVRKRIVWNNETLRQDYGRDYLATVPKYDGFCTVPDHVNYQPIVGSFLNLYEPTGHHPKQGEFPHIEALARHIFGGQYGLGMDYLQLLYLHPIEKLPILLLVSEERNTGKSTFLNFLKALFDGNVTFNTNEDFRSQSSTRTGLGNCSSSWTRCFSTAGRTASGSRTSAPPFPTRWRRRVRTGMRFHSSPSSFYAPTTNVYPS